MDALLWLFAFQFLSRIDTHVQIYLAVDSVNSLMLPDMSLYVM